MEQGGAGNIIRPATEVGPGRMVAVPVPTVDVLDEKFPGIRGRILDDQDKARPYVNIFVDGEDIRETGRERTRLNDGSLVYILPSVAGG